MNKNNVQYIFDKYIENFEVLNNKENDETYKWEIAQEFQNFDVDATDFAEMLNHMWRTSSNLIDNAQQLPFYALVDYARKEPESVREMFRKLYADEEVDDIAKQKLIDEFIMSSEELRKKYYPDSRLYINNQRSVMMYLFLRYPDSNYGYKASQAKSFADCIGFYDDWGPMNNFKLSVFNRMCDQLIEEIKANDALLKTHRSRFEKTKKKLYPDKNLHILALDIIYSSQAYEFYDGITFEPINAQARKLHFERVEKARELSKAAEKAREDMKKLIEGKEFIRNSIKKDMPVKHRKYGEGIIKEAEENAVKVFFHSTKETKELGLTGAVSNGIITFSSDELTQRIKDYAPLLEKAMTLPGILARAEEALLPYEEFLD